MQRMSYWQIALRRVEMGHALTEGELRRVGKRHAHHHDAAAEPVLEVDPLAHLAADDAE